MNMRKTARRGFTLIEVLLVLLILGMLATVGIVAYSSTREGAKKDTANLLVKQVESAMERFNIDLSRYPAEDEGIKALVEKPQFSDDKLAEKWRGPYLKEDPLDPWNNPIKYSLVDDTSSGTTRKVPHIWSMGPDGQDGTDDDIRNWTEAK